LAGQNLKERLVALVEPIAEGMGLVVHDIEVMPTRRLRIRVVAQRKSRLDPTDGITIGECAELSRAIDRALEIDDPIAQSYLLEVSSPGLDRKLKSRRHFELAVGERLELTTCGADGVEKTIVGRLEGLEGEDVELAIDGETQKVPMDQIRKARTLFRIDS